MNPTLQESKSFFLRQHLFLARLREELEHISIHPLGSNMIFEGTFYETPYDDQLISRNVVMKATFNGRGWSVGPIKGELDFGDEGVAEDIELNQAGESIESSLLKLKGMMSEWRFPETVLDEAAGIIGEMIQARARILAAV